MTRVATRSAPRKRSSRLRWLVGAAIVLLTFALLGAGLFAWRAHVLRTQEQRSYQTVQDLLAAHRGAEAVPVINFRNRTVRQQTDEARARWLAVEIAALEQAGHVPRLRALYEGNPRAFENQERAVLLVARAMIQAQNFEAFAPLRESWRARATRLTDWFLLDVDALLLQNQRLEAIKLLNGKSFPGAEDCGRLLRLAVLSTPADLKAAWNYLDRAAALDARNPDVRLFRGQILEGTGQPAAASPEYLAAFLANTNSAQMRDQLAEFYRRTGRYDQAVATWASGLNSASGSDLIWLKAVFWTRVTRTVKFDWSAAQPPLGDVQPLVSFLLKLRPGEFWDETAFQQVPEAPRYAQQQQATFWLKLLDALKRGQEEAALQLIQFNRFRPNSWSRELESALLRVLAFRQSGTLKFPVGLTIPLLDRPTAGRHPLLEQLDEFTRNSQQKLPADLERLLRSGDAFAAVLLAVGWAEAALQLRPADTLPADYPEWVAYAFTQALRFNHGNREALAFAAKQKPSPALEYLVCEILLADGQTDEGLRRVATLAKADSDVGMRAAWLMSLKLIEQKKYAEARRAVEAQPRLATALAGRELLAQVALREGNRALAEQLYTALRDESLEAKAYFAKKAFDDKDYATARRLTEELLKKNPDRLDLRANLDALAKAEAARK